MWVAIHSGRWRKYTASPLFHPTQDKQSRGGRYNVCCMVYYIGRCIAVLIPCSSLGAARETSHLTLLLTRILWFGRLRLRLESFLWTFGIKLPKGSFFESVVTPFCPFWFFFRPMVICSTSGVGAVHFVVLRVSMLYERETWARECRTYCSSFLVLLLRSCS